MAVITVGDVGLRFCDVMLLSIVARMTDRHGSSVPSDGLKRFNAGDRGSFVKLVVVLPIDTVCTGDVTGAWSALMTPVDFDMRFGDMSDKPVMA